MDNLNLLLNAWRKDKNIEKIVDAGFTLATEEVQVLLKTVPDNEHAAITAELSDIAQALTDYITHLDTQRDDIKKQLDKNVENSKACISYVTAGSLGKNKRRDE